MAHEFRRDESRLYKAFKVYYPEVYSANMQVVGKQLRSKDTEL